MKGRAIPLVTLGFMIAAQLLPAFRLAGDIAFGWQATLLSGLGAVIAVGSGRLENGQSLACLAGFAANLAAVIAMVGLLVGGNRRWNRFGAFALTCGILAVVSLLFGSEVFVPFPGCGAWLLAMAAAAFSAAPERRSCDVEMA